MLGGFDGCGLKSTAKNLCFYRGAERSDLMIIGEAPGREEDLEGKPFVGRAGQLLDKMLGAIGMSEADVHITNIVYWRPPGNRTPTPQEALACRPFLERQMALVGPKVVLALGGAAAKHLFDVADGIMRIRGKWREIDMGGHQGAGHGDAAPRLPLAHAGRQGHGVARPARRQGGAEVTRTEAKNAMAKIDESFEFKPLRIATLTVSDTREKATDKSGDVLEAMIGEAGHTLAKREIVTDDRTAIRAKVESWIADASIDVVITTGGTGFTGRDVTPDAVKPLFEKEIEGFSVDLPHALVPERRDVDHPVARLRRHCQRHLHLLSAGVARSLQGRVERHPQVAARQPPPALQSRRYHAAPERDARLSAAPRSEARAAALDGNQLELRVGALEHRDRQLASDDEDEPEHHGRGAEQNAKRQSEQGQCRQLSINTAQSRGRPADASDERNPAERAEHSGRELGDLEAWAERRQVFARLVMLARDLWQLPRRGA